jgi:ABC-type branched-subunit amino acid transport system substrate-binding protein
LFPFITISVYPDTNRYIAQWAKTAGIQKHVTWHTARHTDATLLIEYGADLYTVQHLLGHSNISTTSGYAHLSDKKQRDAVDALPDFGIGEWDKVILSIWKLLNLFLQISVFKNDWIILLFVVRKG